MFELDSVVHCPPIVNMGPFYRLGERIVFACGISYLRMEEISAGALTHYWQKGVMEDAAII
jgi:hypothetical protein